MSSSAEGIRPDVAAFLSALADSRIPPMETLLPAEARAAFLQTIHVTDVAPVPLPTLRHLKAPSPNGSIPLRLFDSRPEREAGPLILFFHGGGFLFGNLDSHAAFCSWLTTRMDLPVLAVDYRLAPEHPFPAAPDDAETVARWVAESPEEIGSAVTALITCGDSAGGNLAIGVCRQLAARPAAVAVSAQWALYPYIGSGTDWPSMKQFAEGFMLARATMEWFDGHYAAPAHDPRHNLLIGDIPDVPLLVLTAGLDPLRDEGKAYADKARSAGVRVHHMEAVGMIHGFVNLRAAIPSAENDLEAFASAAEAMSGRIGVRA